MRVTIEEVRRMAALARLSVPEHRLDVVAAELTSILSHVDALNAVDTSQLEPVTGIGAMGAPLRADHGPTISMSSAPEDFADMQDGFFLVPRVVGGDAGSSA